jgi:CBS domain-containing protein
MKIQDIMEKDVKRCRPGSTLAEAAHQMWLADCGALPVVDEQNAVLGMITDRDICIALGSRNRPASEVTVFDVKPDPKELRSCAPGDDVRIALQAMREMGVRRIPVAQSGKLVGIVSLNDIALHARKRNSLTNEEIVETLQAICEHRQARQTVAA